MDVIQFYLARHATIHGGWTDGLLDALTEDQIRRRPHPVVNSIAWLLWHLARTEDVAVNRFIAGEPQLALEEGWLDRLGPRRTDLGTAMVDEEVETLSQAIDCRALRAYWDAVGRRTQQVVQRLTASDLDEVVSAETVKRVVTEDGVLTEAADWVRGVIEGQTKGAILGQLALSHPCSHFGEARVARALHGFPGR